MNSDEKILKKLEDLEVGQQALQADVTAMKGDVAKTPAIEKQLDQHNKLMMGMADNMATFLTEQHAQREDIRSLHTEVHTTKEELRDEILAARSEAKADMMDLKATVTRRLNDHEKRINVLEDEVDIPHPDKN